MAIRASNYFNSPEMAQAAANLASLFAPPSGADAAGWAAANAKNAEAKRLADLFAAAGAPGFDQSTFDRQNIAVGNYNPTQSYYAQDQNNATTQRGQDRTFAASRLNNADDNTRALEERRMQEAGALQRLYAAPITANKDQTVFLPSQTATATGLPGMLSGNIGAAPGEMIRTPDGRTITGAPKPLSETEVKANERQRLAASGMLTDQMLIEGILGADTPVQAVGPEGKPVFMAPGAAVRSGAQAYVAPSTVKPTNGLAILPDGSRVPAVQGADGRWVAAQTGAPLPNDVQITDMPKPQGAMRDIGVGDTVMKGARNDITSQDIDRAINVAIENPTWTTGFIGGATSGVAGSPSYDLNSLVDTIKANVGFDQLQAMRAASPTGGALGQVSDSENRLLQSVLGSLSTSQSPAQFVYNLKRLKNVYLDIIHGPGNGPQRYDLGDGTPNDPGTDAAPVAPVQRGQATSAPTVALPGAVGIDYNTGALTNGGPPAPPAPPGPPGPPGPGQQRRRYNPATGTIE